MTLCLLPRCVTSDAPSHGLDDMDGWDPRLSWLLYMCSLRVWLWARVSDGWWEFLGGSVWLGFVCGGKEAVSVSCCSFPGL